MRSIKRIISITVVFCMVNASIAGGAELLLTIKSSDSNRLMPARIQVRGTNSKDHIPEGALKVRVGVKGWWFVSKGQTRMEVPAGRMQIRAEHGTECRPYKKTFNIKDDQSNKIAIVLVRWIDMGERGYLCGENHLHVSPEDLAPQLAAEGLDFGSSMQWWNKPRYELPPGKECVCKLDYAGRVIPSGICDYEIEHAWGAAYVLGQPSKLQRKRGGDLSNLPTVRDSHKAGALVCYQAGWSREVLFDALLGYVDVVNVCNNNFHRHGFQPRSRYSNLLDVEGFPIYHDTAVGMMKMNTDTYYRLLNCGLKLAAGAGSATGAKPNPVGYNRAYVRTPKDSSLQQFLEAWRQGRNFVTCGPMIFLTVNDRYRPGDTIRLKSKGQEVSIQVRAVSDQPLRSIEIVVNGQVINRQGLRNGSDSTLKTNTTITADSWIAARCTNEDRLLTDKELAEFDSGKGRMPVRPTRLRYAHTSPVYVEVDGRGVRVPESIVEAQKMLDAFESFINKAAKGQHKEELLTELEKARQRLGNQSS
ncbi:MAG: CehA/McbA family metallohydrolase [Planctomycetota bacterium]